MTLEDAKQQVREELLKGGAPGVVGVGIDPVNEKLLVLSNDEQKTHEFLLDLKDKGLPSSQVKQVQIDMEPKRAQRESNASLRQALAANAPVPLRPASVIEPQGGDQGCLGCFVSLPDGTNSALTVAHLFHRRNAQPVSARLCQAGNNCLRVIGGSQSFGALATNVANKADCALFSLNGNTTLNRNNSFSGNFVGPAQVPATDRATVENLASGYQGTVYDPKGVARYPLYLGNGGAQTIVFDDQILIFSPDSNFGVEGDSGSPVFMAADGPPNTFKKGDLLGLYSAIVGAGQYHFATPLHACLTALGATGIFQP